MAYAKNLSDEAKKKLVALVEDCCTASDKFVGERIKAWEDAEKLLMSYQPTAKAERQARDAAEEDGFSQLKIPYAWGLLMAQHTYLCSIFLGKSNLFQFAGNNSKGQLQVPEVETIMDYQADNGGMFTALYVALYDLLVYGLCLQFYTWREDVTSVTAYVEKPKVVEGVPVIENGQPVMETEEVIQKYAGYKGGGLINVKPKDGIYDPSVGLVNYQEGNFIGRRYQEKITVLQHKQRQGIYFGTEDLSTNMVKDTYAAGNNPALLETEDPSTNYRFDRAAIKGEASIRELYIKLIPSEMGIGANTDPEIWVLTVANRTKLIGCAPAGWIHGKFPAFLATTEYDGYTLSSRGTLEIAKPLNDTMNWLINTHMYNVEKAVNNEFIYDPSMINQRDFLDPRPGKRIRIRPEAYGKDVRTFVHQFQQYDYTKQNIQDVQFIEALFQRVFGVNEQMLGALAQGGRKTATEVRSAAGFALNRLKVMSEWLGKSWFAPMGKQMLAACRQMYTVEDKFYITSTENSQVREFSPEEISGAFDLTPVDGSIPVDRMGQVAILREIMMGISQLPGIAGRYDVAKFFEYVVKLMGVKNMDQFAITDPAKIAQEASLGNLVTGGNDGATRTDSRQTGVATGDVAGTGAE